MPDEPDSFEGLPPAAPPPVRVGRRPRVKPGANIEGVDERLLNFAAERNFTATSGRDSAGVHVRGSLHGGGRALDLRTRDKTPAQVERALREARESGLHAEFERAGVRGATGDHIHLSTGGRRTTRPTRPDEPDSFDGLPPVEEPDSFEGLPAAADVSQDVSRGTPQVNPQAPLPPPSVVTMRPELPAPNLVPPGARESVTGAPLLPPAVGTPTPTTPQPATNVGTKQEEGAAAGAAPSSTHFAALDRPGYAEALHGLIAKHGLTDASQLATYTKWLSEVGASGDLADPAFRAQVIEGRITATRPPAQAQPAQGRAPTRPTEIVEAPTAHPAQVRPNVAQDVAAGAPNIAADVASPSAASVPQQSGSGGVRVAADANSTLESLAVGAFEAIGRQSGLDAVHAGMFARQAAADLRDRNGGRYFRGVEDEAAFLEQAKAAGGAVVGLSGFDAQTVETLLRLYSGGQQSGRRIEAQMSAETGVIQPSTAAERAHHEEVRRQAEQEVAREFPAEPSTTPAGVPSPDPSRAIAAEELRAREVETRVQGRLAMERIHGELSAMTVDRERLKQEMRAAVDDELQRMATGASKAGQEYAGGLSAFPRLYEKEVERLAEERTQSLIEEIEYAKRATDPHQAIGALTSLYHRFQQNPLVLFPIASSIQDFANVLPVRESAARIQQAEARGEQPAVRDQLTMQTHQAAQHLNKSFWAKVGDVVIEQPSFWGEFYLTGPAASAIEGAVGRGLARVGIRGLEEGAQIGTGALRSRLGARVLGEEALGGTSLSLAQRSAFKVGEIVSKTVQTTVSGTMRAATVGIPHIAEGYVKRRLKGEDGQTAFLHSVLDTAGEYISESQGETLALLPGMKRLDEALRPIMGQFNRAGYHGVLGEIYEERWKDLYDVVAGLQTWQQVKQKWEDPETWGVEAVGFALPGVGRAAAGHAAGALKSLRQEFGQKQDDITRQIEELRTQPPTEQTAAQIADLEEEQQHYDGLVRDLDTHAAEVERTEAELATEAEQQQASSPAVSPPEVQTAGSETAATAAPAPQTAPEGGQAAEVEEADYQGEERRAEPRTEEGDFEYFRTALSDIGVNLVKLPKGQYGAYQFQGLKGGNVRVTSHEEMTAKSRELLIKQQAIEGEFSTPEGAGAEGERAVTAAGGRAQEAEDFADEILREMQGGGEAQTDENGFRPFPAESKAMGIPRSTMPQIRSEHRGALVQYLKGRGVEHEQMKVRPSVLKPTQAEYSPAKVEKARERAGEGSNRSILVSGDGYVLDGTHQWEQALEDAPEEPYPVIVFHGDAKELLPLIADFPSSYANKESEGGPKVAPLTAEDFADEIMGELTGAGQTPAGTPPAAGAEETTTSPLRTQMRLGELEPGDRFQYRIDAGSGNGLEYEVVGLGQGGGVRARVRVRNVQTGEESEATNIDLLIVRTGKRAAPPSSGERGPGRSGLVGDEKVTPPAAPGKSPNISTPATQGTGAKSAAQQFGEDLVNAISSAHDISPADINLTVEEKQLSERDAIRQRREDIKSKLLAARDRRLKGEPPDQTFGMLGANVPLPSREEVVLTAQLLLTYAEEGTLLFKEAAGRFIEDVGADYARELADAFQTGWRLLKRKGFEADEPGLLADHIKEEDDAVSTDDTGDRRAGGQGEVSDEESGQGEGAPREGGEEAPLHEEEEYLPVDPFTPQPNDPPRVALGRKFARAFYEGRSFRTIVNARAFASDEWGVPIVPGTTGAKDVDEAIEIGVGIAARETVRELRGMGKDDSVIYRHLVHIYTEQQPNLSVRTSTSAIDQAYSTPAPLAFVASRLAGVNRRTSFLDNSAGNGMLAIEAAPEAVVFNEKNAARYSSLEALFPLADVRQGDALKLQLDRQVDRYVANPPFGLVKDAVGQSLKFEPLPGWTTTQIDHAISFTGLASMADKGRGVLIVGSVQNEVDQKKRGDQYDAKDKRLFYYHLYRTYNVVDHFTVSGDLYQRQGAGWPVDVIVIDGRGKSSRRLPAADPPRVYKTWDALAEVLKNEHVEPAVSGVDAGDRPQGPDGATGGRHPDPGGAGATGRGDVPGVSGRPPRDVAPEGGGLEGGAVRPGESAPVGGVTGAGARDDESTGGRGDITERPGATDAAGGAERAGQDAEADTRGESGGEATRRGDQSGDVDGARPEPPERAKVDITKTQVSYAPASTARGMQTLTPVNMATAAQDALDALIKRLGGVRGDDTLDRYVADRLGYEVSEVVGTPDKPGYFGAEQVDAIALAIDNIERGAGMIIGDQTGIGKGRVVAAVLRYARIQNRTPIFITEKPNLYKDMARDLEDIGEGTLEELRERILMTNADQTVPLNDDEESPINLRTPAAKTHNTSLLAVIEQDIPGVNGFRLPEGKQYLFTTYSQMQKLKKQITARQKFLYAMSEGAVLVFDESHNAGGTDSAGGWGKKDKAGPAHDPLSRAGFARSIINQAHGVFYSSATFAKRPSVMDLYSKTDMRLSVSNLPLADMIAKGGVPLQQIVSSMLVESGQMLRRERSFEGIEYATAVAPVDQESAETVASVMNTVFEFDKIKKEALAGIVAGIRENAETLGFDPATGAASASSTTFSSLIHNLVDQMLLSLKMEATIQHTLETLRQNEKPVITVAFTMGSFLQDYAEEFDLQPGEAVGLNFGDMLKRYLERTREVTYKRPDGTKYRLRLTDEQLGPAGVALYNQAVEQIQEADWSKMPVSPIDYIKYRIESEVDPKTGRNYVVGEITGRSYALDYSEHFRTKGEAPPVFRRRPQKEKNIKGRIRNIVGFNGGSIDVMVLNQAGSTGLSLHSSERVPDQRKRHMIVAQPERNIDTHMQLLGRIHRTGQVVLPRYTQLVADIPSEKRPAAVLAKKMASLNANTTAARGSKFKSEQVVDFMNQYGDLVAFQMMENNPTLHERLGNPLDSSDGMEMDDAARKVTGRLPILTLAEQESVYDELEQEYKDMIERLNALGENALEAQTLALDARTTKYTTVFEGTGNRPFERGAVAEDVDVKRLRKPYSIPQVLDLVRTSLEKRLAELKISGDTVSDEGGLPELAEAGEWLQGHQREAVNEEVKEYLVKELEAILAAPRKDESQEEADSRAEQRRRVTETRIREVLRRFNDVHSRFHIGQTVQVVSPLGELYGVITDIHRAGRTQHPASLGAWRIQVALADAARAVPIPFSKIRTADNLTTATDANDFLNEYAVSEADEASIFDYSTLKRITVPVLEAFERGQSVSREKRVIITGNLLAGFGRFEKSRGQIINFTDSEGNLRQGILMPKDFDVEKALDDEPVVFADVGLIIHFLNTTPGMVHTPDLHFKIVKHGDNFKFTAPRARGVGAQYWGNQAILSAAGEDFVTKGDVMVLIVNRRRAQAIIQAALDQGWTLQTNSHKDAARDIIKRGNAPGGREATGGGLASPRRGAAEAEDRESSRAGGRPSLTAQREPEADVEDFQVSQRVRAILRRLNLPNAEKSLSNRLLGIFKLREKKVRVQSLFDVFTAAHEAMHGISDAEEIGERVIADTGRGAHLRDRLTEIYVDFYPRAKRTHPLKRRIEEGLAVLAERYLLDPADTQKRYADLVAAFIKPGGKYHSQRTTQLLDEMAALVGDYARMTGAQRIGARIASGKEVVERDAGYSRMERTTAVLFNKVEPLRRYAKQADALYTQDDPMASYFGVLNRSSLTHGWVEGRRLAVLRSDGTYELRDGSVKTYLKMIKGREKEFDIFLVARRVVSDHNRRAELLAEAHDPATDPERAAEALREAAELLQVLENDDFHLGEAIQVVTDIGPDFIEAARVYDAINKALVDFSAGAGLITKAYARKLRGSQGYAAFVRKVYDENQSDYSSTQGTANSQTKVRTFKTRSGSTLDIISPVYTQITSIGEVIGKGLQNRVWTQVLSLGEDNPELARRFEVIPTETAVDERGRVVYPQMRDPQLIHILVDGEHVFVKPGQEFADVAAHLRPQELDTFAKWVKAPSAFFTRLTTSANPIWALGNLTIDQVTAAMNTQTGFKPVYDPAKSLVHYVEHLYATAYEKLTGNKTTLRGAELFERYMELGGKKQTFASQHEIAPQDAVARVLGGRTTFQHVGHIFDLGLGLLELPSNLSEYLTRYSEFRRALERGDTDEVAMYKAAEVTVAFQQRGSWGGKMGENWIQTLPYFNALVQVNYKFLRNAKEQPLRTAGVAAALMVSALGSALALLRWLDDDDERKQLFMNLPARELTRAIYLPDPTNSKRLIRIRIPEQIGAITGLMYLYAVQHYGGQPVKRDERFEALTSPLPEQVDLGGVMTEGLWGLAKPLLSWLPAAVRPSVQVVANIKSYPEIGPIVPKRLQDMAPELQFNDYTSAVGKQFGSLLGVSPMKVDYWIRNQFGAVGGAVLGKFPAFPLTRTVREYEIAERAYDNFYAQKTKADEQMQRLKAAAKGDYQGSFSEAERKEIIQAATLYEKMGDVLTNVRKAQGLHILPPELKQEVYKTLLFFDTSAEIGKKAAAIERLNTAVLKHAKTSGAKMDLTKEEAVPKGMERVTREGVIDLNINRRREIKLPPPTAPPK